MAPTEVSPSADSAWVAFWRKGGFWRALLLVIGYLALYTAGSYGIDALWGDSIDADNPLSTASSIYVGVVAPIGVGIVVLLIFGLSTGLLRGVFGPQPIRGSKWMWVMPILVVVISLSRFISADYGAYKTDVIVAILVVGVFVGFAEELLARGYVINLLRFGGTKELWVAVLSSVLFACMHLVNLVSGQEFSTVGVLLLYTFAFGVAMYFSLRVTGRLIWVMVLHGITDPAAILFSGGIDSSATDSSNTGGLTTVALLGTVLLIALGWILVWFVRGRVTDVAVSSIHD